MAKPGDALFMAAKGRETLCTKRVRTFLTKATTRLLSN